MTIPDAFAEHFAELADQAYKQKPSETLRAVSNLMRQLITEDEGAIPDVVVMVSGTNSTGFHHNGVTEARIVWMLEQMKFMIFSSSQDED